MLKVIRWVTLAAAAALVMPAAAGSWPPTPPRKAAQRPAPAVSVAQAPQPKATDGFEFVGGEAGWQLAQHKYELANGKLVMSDECDHAIRTAQAAPTREQLDTTRRLYPGG